MASLYIREIDDSLLWELRKLAASERVTLKALVVPVLQMLVNSKPVEYAEPERPIVVPRPGHDPRTCRIYRCGRCAALKEVKP